MKNDELLKLLKQFTLLSLIIIGLCIALLCSIAVKNHSDKRLGRAAENPVAMSYYFNLAH